MDSLESRQKLGLGLGRNILYVGRLDKLKGLDILLRAVARLEDMPDVRLLIVGGTVGDQETSDLRLLARELGIDRRVDFLGSVDQTLLPRYYAASDVCVLPSHYESFGFAALEAAACEKPVVASNVGGLPSVVLSGETGYLISWQCPGPFATCLELLLENHYLRRSLGRAAREHATTLTWDVSVDALMVLYESLVSDRLSSLTVA
jgi:D-inositol-3-phosphate glycosyltransferase